MANRKRIQKSFEGSVSRTQRNTADAVNINSIMAKYRLTGTASQRPDTPTFSDFSQVTDYFDAVLLVQEANESFMTLDPHLRAKFNNNPGEFLAAVEDPLRRQELTDLGVFVKNPSEPTADVDSGAHISPT